VAAVLAKRCVRGKSYKNMLRYSEPSPECLQWGFTFVQGCLTYQSLTKTLLFIVFYISIWGAKTTKATPGRRDWRYCHSVSFLYWVEENNHILTLFALNPK